MVRKTLYNEFLLLLEEYGIENRMPFIASRSRVLVSMPFGGEDMVLTSTDLQHIRDGETNLKIKGLTFIDDCGLAFHKYAEFFIWLGHPKFSSFEGQDIWLHPKPLRFNINKVRIEVGPASSIIVLLFSRRYTHREYFPEGISHFPTIKISCSSPSEYTSYFNKALFYLNSHYLRDIGLYGYLMHLDFEDDQSEYESIGDNAVKLGRQRIRTRRDFQNVEPLAIYNNACTLSAENRFLEFYRILEFFFERNKTMKISQLRFDKTITAEELIRSAIIRSERDHLAELAFEITTPSIRDSLTYFAQKYRLIAKRDFSLLPTALYEFRNSLVHAKENEITRTRIPDPFNSTYHLHSRILDSNCRSPFKTCSI